MVDAVGSRLEFDYGAGGYLSQVTSAIGDVTSYAYDSAGNLTNVTWPTNPLGSPQRNYTCDSEDRLIEYLRETGDKIEYGYDLGGRLAIQKVNSSVMAEFRYDSSGSLIEAKDPLGTIGITRNALGQATRIEYPNGSAIEWTYSTAGRVTQVSGGGFTSDVGYDPQGRLGSIGTNLGAVEYTYDSAGRVTGMIYPNGVEAVFEYINGRTRRFEYRNIGGSDGDTIIFEITRDSMGRITRTYRSDLAETMVLSFNPRAEITATDIARASDTLAYRYAYDSSGNRIRFVVQGETTNYIYVPGNLLDSGAENYEYNLAGEVTAIGARSITYDAEGRIATDTTPTGTVTYDYDAFGNRVRATTGGTAEWRLWDQFGNEIADADEEGNVVEFRYYVPGRMDALIGFSRGESTYFTLPDPAGNIAIVLDGNANMVARYAYEPFGMRADDSFDSVDNRFRYAKRREERSGEVYVRARSLDVATSRFMQRDPLFIGNNSDPFSWSGYLYANNDGVNLKDLTGLDCVPNTNVFDYSLNIPLPDYEEIRPMPSGGSCKLMTFSQVLVVELVVKVTTYSLQSSPGPPTPCPDPHIDLSFDYRVKSTLRSVKDFTPSNILPPIIPSITPPPITPGNAATPNTNSDETTPKFTYDSNTGQINWILPSKARKRYEDHSCRNGNPFGDPGE